MQNASALALVHWACTLSQVAGGPHRNRKRPGRMSTPCETRQFRLGAAQPLETVACSILHLMHPNAKRGCSEWRSQAIACGGSVYPNMKWHERALRSAEGFLGPFASGLSARKQPRQKSSCTRLSPGGRGGLVLPDSARFHPWLALTQIQVLPTAVRACCSQSGTLGDGGELLRCTKLPARLPQLSNANRRPASQRVGRSPEPGCRSTD